MSDIKAKPLQSAASLRNRPQGRLAILLVVANGLILTIAATVMLGMFIRQMVEAESYVVRTEVNQMASDRVAQIQSSFDLVAALVGTPNGEQKIHSLFAKRPGEQGNMPFTQVMWFPENNISSLNAHQLYPERPDDSLDLARVLAEISPIYSRLSHDDQARLNAIPIQTSLVREVSHRTVDQRIQRLETGTLALVRSVDMPDGHGLLLALLPGDGMINMAWLRQRGNIERLRILSHQGQNKILDTYYVLRTDSPEPPIKSQARVGVVSFAGWAQNLGLQVATRENRQTQILHQVPMLLLFFGLLLTLLGSLYVRNNQKQSALMAKMNRALALKNMELNSQVSERERLNQALRKNERENRAIINAVSDIIFETDTEGNILFLNDSWQRITGFDLEQTRGRRLFDMLVGDDIAVHQDDFHRLVHGQKSAFRFLTRLRTLEENARMVEVSFSMMRIDDNKNMRIVGTITDVEERRRAEMALGEAERKYRTIWENAASGIYQATPEGQLLTANPALAGLFGYDGPAAMIENIKNVNRQLYASIKERQGMIRDLMVSGQIQNVEVEGVRADHSRFWLRESARLVKDDQGNILYFEGSIDDISEQKEAEFKLRDAMLESDLANRSKTEFLANMSHELRTPLNAIIGFSEIIRDEVFGKLEQRQYWEYAKDIHESGRHLLSIINTILDVARIEAGERQLNEALVPVRHLATNAVDLIMPKADLNQQQVNIVIPDDIPDLVCEELAVKQILLNLLSNAIKFTPTGGRITVSAEIERAGDLRIAVTDTGIGLDEDEIERVMAPFGQASGSFSRSSSGAGLGLTLVHSLVRLHGGRLEMFSQKNIGTTVAVMFPASRLQARS